MSLDVHLLETKPCVVFSSNITHNLGHMAKGAGIYECLWHPEDVGVATANQLIEPLEKGLKMLKGNPEIFKELNPENGWGSYENLMEFVASYIAACKENPDAVVEVSR